MQKLYSTLFILGVFFTTSWSQITTDPAFPKADEPITFTIDASGTGLDGYTDDVWVWTWISQGCSGTCDAPTNVNPATSAQSAALATRSGGDPNVYTITFTPTDFFGKPASEFEQIGLLLKGQDWSDGQTSDYFVDISSGAFEVGFTAPTSFPLFVNTGENVEIAASASETADFSLTINGVEVATATGTTTIAHTEVAGAPGSYAVEVTADNSTTTATGQFTFIVRSTTEEVGIPVGVIKGINYDPADPTKVTLALLAPMKSSVYVVGDFTGWEIDPAYQMKKDGELFWLEITGLTAGEEYAFQYLVDEEIYVADPYADKILDPDDQYIPANTYPDLKAYPDDAKRDKWYYNRLAVLQTGQTAYQWQPTSYTMPAEENLIIYELLIRDFFANGEENYQNLIDTLLYLEDLGVNAIELMPIMEFNGNESWGYNPTFMFAPDKFYGTKNKFKEFVDKAHEKGIAVILDIAMNHNDIPAPYALMYFDFNNSKPTADNPWFNTDAKHPFNVFFDYNHESAYTQDLLDTVNHYWLNEYKIDGFRFDLSKGFTQTKSGGDVGAWSSYDASRVALLKRMADDIWSHSPDAYVILEHFADNTEEKELADYGMMLWGNLNHAYNQNTMGYADDSSISWGYYGNRGWSSPYLITYMESHDEERLMYKNLQYGNTSGSYSVKDINTGLERIRAASALFYTIPGPKMLWQFGEVGYDKSINTCPDGTINDGCRVSPKPIPWNDVDGLDYNHNDERMLLLATVAEIIKLRNTYSVFQTTDVTLEQDGLIKELILKNDPYTTTPATSDEMNVYIVANFDVTAKTIDAAFPHNGKWYHYFAGGHALNVSAIPHSLKLEPGEFGIYTDVQLPPPPDELLEIITATDDDVPSTEMLFYPNPASGSLRVRTIGPDTEITISNMSGQRVISEEVRDQEAQIDVRHLPTGVYIVTLRNNFKTVTTKLIKN